MLGARGTTIESYPKKISFSLSLLPLFLSLLIMKKKETWFDYDLSQLDDSKAGYMQQESQQDEKHAKRRRVVYEHELLPPVDPLDPEASLVRCRHCRILDVDMDMYRHYTVAVCRSCRDARPEEYTLLTKTEVKEDYLLTEEELNDGKLMPHWERPNPRKSSFARMKLYLREQVETFAFEKWNGPEGLDKEWQRRLDEKERRKEVKFKSVMSDLRKRTRIQERLNRQQKAAEKKTNDTKHEHEFELTEEEIYDDETGEPVRRCVHCGLEMVVDEF